MKYTGTLIGELSGSLGALTASRNRGGYYLRQRVIPTNPNSGRQSIVRAIVQDLQAKWTSLLTNAERLAWTTYAENTPGFTGVGMNAYVQCNLPRLNADAILATTLGRIDTAPAIFDRGSFSPFTCAVTAPSTFDVSYNNADSWATATGGALLIYAGTGVNESRNNYFGRYHLIGAAIGDTTTPPTSPESATTDLLVVAGQKVFTKCAAVQADGRYSASQRFPDVAA